MNLKPLQEINYPATRLCTLDKKSDFSQVDRHFLELEQIINTHPYLHPAHFTVSLFFFPKDLTRFVFAYEVIGQGENLLEAEQAQLIDVPATKWISSENLANDAMSINSEEFRESIFNFPSFLHNKGYSANGVFRMLFNRKPLSEDLVPAVFVQFSNTAIDIISKEK